jgi:hypothetical protein
MKCLMYRLVPALAGVALSEDTNGTLQHAVIKIPYYP